MKPLLRTSAAQRLAAIYASSTCLLFSASGCVALNLPSQRFHDPGDHGGILGSWKSGVVDPTATRAFGLEPGLQDEHQDQSTGLGTRCVDGGPLDVDPFDTSIGEHAKPPEAPEIPWPRFHPVPTRPVLGN